MQLIDLQHDILTKPIARATQHDDVVADAGDVTTVVLRLQQSQYHADSLEFLGDSLKAIVCGVRVQRENVDGR